MKAKVKLLESIILVIVIFLDFILLNMNIAKTEGKYDIEPKSVPNYINVPNEEKKDNDIIIKDTEEPIEVVKEEVVSNPVVYDGLTLDELSSKLELSLNSNISGYGKLIATHSLELGVDPYMAVAIMLQETGCAWECSYIVRECNNVGGQKGKGCGSYSYFPSMEEGITNFIDNLYNNFISYGLTTPDTINPKYAADTSWSANVNKYIEIIKAR